jgi:hypothetical protein
MIPTDTFDAVPTDTFDARLEWLFDGIERLLDARRG